MPEHLDRTCWSGSFPVLYGHVCGVQLKVPFCAFDKSILPCGIVFLFGTAFCVFKKIGLIHRLLFASFIKENRNDMLVLC